MISVTFESDAGPIEGFVTASIRTGVNTEGVGSITLPPDVADEIDGPIRCRVDGQVVFVWTPEDRDASADDAEIVTVSGRGRASALERAIVLPVGYPDFTSRTRTETGAPLAVLSTLLAEAQGRGRVTDLTPSWTATEDSNGDPWTEQVSVTLEPGTNLRELLDSLSEVEGAEWAVRPDGTIDAAPQLGQDRSGEVVLFYGRDQIRRSRRSSSREQRQTIYIEASTGVSEATNTSDADAGELWLEAQDYADPLSRQALADKTALKLGAPEEEADVVIPAEARPFVRFFPGDLVGLDSGTGAPEPVRVVAISLEVGDQVDVRVEATLLTEVALRAQRIERAIQAKADVQLAASPSIQRRHGLVTADKFLSGAVGDAVAISSENYVPGQDGWAILGNGNAEFNDAVFRGDLQSDNYDPGVAGWRLDRDGFAEFEEGLFRGDIVGSSIVGSTFRTAPEEVNEYQILLRQLSNVGEIVFFDDGGQEFGALRGVPFPGFTTAVQLTSEDGLLVFAQGQLQLTSQDWTIGIDGDASLRTVVTSSNAQVGGQLDVLEGATVGEGFSVLSGQASMLGTLFVAGTTSMANNLSVIGTTSSTFFVGDGSGLTNLPTPSIPSNPTFDVVDANQYRFRSGAAFPRLDRSGSNIQIRTAGSVRSKGDAGFFIEDGLTNLSFSANAFLGATGRIFRGVSRRDTKRDITYGEIDGVLDLRPAFYMPIVPEGETTPTTRQYGLIAEDVEEAGLTELVGYDADGRPLSVNYDRVGVALIPYVRDLVERVTALEEKRDAA